ncbi:DUF3291 domain-containing protein [Oceanicella sp. SM1341]|uniref:DUF3291 domain-containing protein n=1 Tax=Oceanicella sp. SM1341 TaxID=1548889 RepID=UPI000E4DF1F7|nr:DUF3291 domain-containing protein [Oceanicella sp. SM1341]
MHLAQFNIALAKYPLDDPRMADFVNNVGRMKALAARSPGFLWQFKEDGADEVILGDPLMTWTLSLWEGPEALAHFAFRTAHRQFFRRRAEWFPVLDHNWLVLWYIPEGEKPTLAEALARKARMDAEGPGEHAFGWERFAEIRELRAYADG